MQELPWFKFSPSEWLSGDISSLSFEAQGLFINICALYWKQGCSLSVAKLKRRHRNARAMLEQCLEELEDEGILSIGAESIYIDFLDEQYKELTEKHHKRVEAGRKGGKAKAMLKQSSSNKEEEVDIESEEEKEQDPFTPSSNPKPSSSHEWHMVKMEPWVTGLKSFGAKIGPNNWEHWKRLHDSHGDTIKQALEAVKAPDRWPDQVEAQLTKTELGSASGIKRNEHGRIIL